MGETSTPVWASLTLRVSRIPTQLKKKVMMLARKYPESSVTYMLIPSAYHTP
jgi:hypothetical protein